MDVPLPVTYRNRLTRELDSLGVDTMRTFEAVVVESQELGSRVWRVGNGGGATTEDHFATDLIRCSDMAGRPVRGTSLCSNVRVISATSNDFGYEHIFARQLKMLATLRDVLVAITTSDNSPNIIAAINRAKEHLRITIGLTGFDGGVARALVDVSVHVESAKGDYGVVEDAHLVACHMVADALRVDQVPIQASEG